MEKEYFSKLNYSLANEDTALEFELLPENSNHVVSVCGSGSRILPLLAKNPKKLTLVDYSDAQIALTKLRLELLKTCDYPEFLGFMGYSQMETNKKKEIFFKLQLSEHERNSLLRIFEQHKWSDLIYMGSYEKMLQKISKVVQLGLGEHCQKIFQFSEQNEFIHYYENNFPKLRWHIILTLLGNSTVLNALLYKGSHPRKNIPLSYRAYYLNLFDELFKMDLPNKAFFLQMIFTGKLIDLTGAPLEANRNFYEKMQNGLKNCHIEFYQGDLIETISQKITEKIDFISFSDILSYFSGELEKNYLQIIKDSLNKNALTVHRYYLRINKNLVTNDYSLVNDSFLRTIEQESTKIYHIDIYQRN